MDQIFEEEHISTRRNALSKEKGDLKESLGRKKGRNLGLHRNLNLIEND
jgi:hypothetical protein